MSSFSHRLLAFLTGFPAPAALPEGVQAYNPYREPEVLPLLTEFARRYYAGSQARVALLGINPGRLGGGRTGVAFTDPFALTRHCGIAHGLPLKQPELSSQFVYKVVEALGGPGIFYQHFYLGSIYPLVLLRQGLNYNYYDSPALIKALWDDMRRSLRQQVEEVGLRRDVAVCLGKRNGKFFQQLNDELGLFDQLLVLDHPRYLMQYRRRDLDANVAHYVQTLGACLPAH
ncbi:hypothetical protein GCM10023185_23040 [Hymenobacter saemangeumensis]|uniref:Uracil-DNA glycosylase-like domain-containing protein n=1 Tax=Hymenobacter saemangeumensis TaxID=1084522 RepID=A0ABP8IFY8_9BACT